ncbi:MAG: adenosylhomocysteinase [Clostridia bacterium]|nr:adenosylhomocysteinase [Clostridia bacterium]
MENRIRDMALAPSGREKIEWVRRNMPLLRGIEREFSETRPFSGLRVALSIHLEAKTAYLCRVLKAGGAEMYVTGSNPLSTQDDVAAALADEGLCVHAVHGCSMEDYMAGVERVVEAGPAVVIDDGGDLVHCLHTKYPALAEGVLGGCEETTTGIVRLRAMVREGVLRFPMMAVNDAMCKHLFDNRYGTGQSVFDGIDRTTNLIVAGKCVVVAGYGWCGKGVAMRARGLGARVIVTEVDPVKAIEAVMDGFSVMPMLEAAPLGDVFVTVTGDIRVIGEEAFLRMKDGVLLTNAGHFDVEVDVKRLGEIAAETRPMKPNIMGYRLENGRWLYVLAEGRLVNIAAGDGHPAEIMDLSFAIQALAARHVVENRGKLAPGLYPVPREIDYAVAEKKLAFMGVRIDALTEEQRRYLDSWQA